VVPRCRIEAEALQSAQHRQLVLDSTVVHALEHSTPDSLHQGAHAAPCGCPACDLDCVTVGDLAENAVRRWKALQTMRKDSLHESMILECDELSRGSIPLQPSEA